MGALLGMQWGGVDAPNHTSRWPRRARLAEITNVSPGHQRSATATTSLYWNGPPLPSVQCGIVVHKDVGDHRACLITATNGASYNICGTPRPTSVDTATPACAKGPPEMRPFLRTHNPRPTDDKAVRLRYSGGSSIGSRETTSTEVAHVVRDEC